MKFVHMIEFEKKTHAEVAGIVGRRAEDHEYDPISQGPWDEDGADPGVRSFGCWITDWRISAEVPIGIS